MPSAEFTFATVPVNVMAASLVPSPTVNVRPVVCARVIRPWATDIVIFTAPVAASTSATLMPVIDCSVSSFTVCAPGTVSTGASLTAATVIATVPLSVFAPPEPAFA